MVQWLILLPLGVVWYIMGYESDPIPSYPYLRDCSSPVKLITPLTRLFLQFIYRVLIPPSHQPARPRHPLRLRAQFIYGAAGHLLRYVCLPPLDLHPTGVEPRGFYCLLYRWVLPLSSYPALRHHPRDLSRRAMVERRQELKHLQVNR